MNTAFIPAGAQEAAARTDLLAKARRGFAFMDRSAPGWKEMVDLDELDIGHACGCILGQVHPEQDFNETVKRLRMTTATQVSYGLFVDEQPDIQNWKYDLLTDIWHDLITGAIPATDDSAEDFGQTRLLQAA